ncbi:hypothetical protein COU00_01070 [Candidatus Falkowbacteria bacterium CG10_big_fil_rev_8_21_14_0_10_43_11]|uniref:Uncharacterized protein n=1 Tax=Candidatus Falkowbacteria bacterium CG10_big_fil_rev_8_21_14_0_10_43_11 TaxID=1974568 RepID=A0A2M6WMM5_9BACT|nr:MAG: hypothetical protein COU00_01070 [Candidatus Falkowbacteria bacterium CG10_big_fil_rev_8_21_14_0_10_43_11]
MGINLSQIYGLLHFKAQNAKTGLSILWRDTGVRLMTLVSLLLNSVNWSMAVFINLKITDEIIALHHNIYFGITLIGPAKEVYFIPFFGLLIIIINVFLAYLVKEDDRFFMSVFGLSSILANVFLTLGLAAVMLINFR